MYSFLKIDVDIICIYFLFQHHIHKRGWLYTSSLIYQIIIMFGLFPILSSEYLLSPWHGVLIVWYFVIYVFLYIFVQTTKVVHVLVALLKCTLWLLLQLVDNVWNMMIFCRGFESHLPPKVRKPCNSRAFFCLYGRANLFVYGHINKKVVSVTLSNFGIAPAASRRERR